MVLPPVPPQQSPPAPRSRVVGVRRAAAAEADGDAIAEQGDVDTPLRWRYLGAGIAAAWLLGFVLPGTFQWVLAALPHEMGHATVGCLLGRPSAPAISLAGHAWTGIGERCDWLVWLMAIALAATAYVQRARLGRCVPLAVLAISVPLFAFATMGEILIAAGGHLGELVFAAYCYAICWSGGRTGTAAERGAGAMAGALLQHGNVKLCWGLLNDTAAREHYSGSGSLGLKNDYLVLAEDLCNCGLGRVAGVMLVASVLALPLGLWWGVLQERHRED
jgi:hypothetical protein